MMNPNAPEIANRVARILGVKGYTPPMVGIDESVTLAMIIGDVRDPDPFSSPVKRRVGGGGFVDVPAANNGAAEILNVSGSGTMIDLIAIYVSAPGGVPIDWTAGWTTGVIGATVAQQTAYLNDWEATQRGTIPRAQPTGLVRLGNQVAAQPHQRVMYGVVDRAMQPCSGIPLGITIGPGAGFCVCSTSAAGLRFGVSFIWDEYTIPQGI